MFVVVLSHVDFSQASNGQKQLPSTKRELHAAVTKAMIGKTAAVTSTREHGITGVPTGAVVAVVLAGLLVRMLELVAFHNQTGTPKRVLASDDVQEALASGCSGGDAESGA